MVKIAINTEKNMGGGRTDKRKQELHGKISMRFMQQFPLNS